MEANHDVATGSQVQADLAVLQGTASKLVADYRQLEASITTLRSEAEMHAATWDGEAKLAWVMSMAGVNAAWARLNHVLDEIAGNIAGSASEYEAADLANAQSLGQIDVTGITAALSPGQHSTTERLA
jgi:WXG100 family type VII secretion target